ALLRTLADRMLVMSAGHIVETGPAAQTLQRPVAPYTRDLLACVPRPETSASHMPLDRGSLVEIRNLRKTYHARRFVSAGHAPIPALRGVDLALQAGATVGLVGASGSGKSTLAHCLARLEDSDSGEIWFGGIDVARLHGSALRAYRRNVQVIFQDAAAALNPALTAEEIVAEPLEIHRLGSRREQRERALALLHQVGLPPSRRSALPSELSGGQRHRLAIARALALMPSLLILDEAFSGVDLRVQKQLVDLLRALRDQHSLTYLCISHDLGLVSAFADQIAVMHEGRIIERDRVSALFRGPRHPETVALIAAMPRLDCREPVRHG
ncbi:MAG: ABC transporter ATP-binding protein, partial [Acidobacteria bacterium]|nr:ABC transporter ATP-binding protein [Acidobacteriota bacterium]